VTLVAHHLWHQLGLDELLGGVTQSRSTSVARLQVSTSLDSARGAASASRAMAPYVTVQRRPSQPAIWTIRRTRRSPALLAGDGSGFSARRCQSKSRLARSRAREPRPMSSQSTTPVTPGWFDECSQPPSGLGGSRLRTLPPGLPALEEDHGHPPGHVPASWYQAGPAGVRRLPASSGEAPLIEDRPCL